MTTYHDPMTVYICDDNKEHMKDLQDTLQSMSKDSLIKMKLFTSSTELMSQLESMQRKKEKMPELLLLDIELPEENGIHIGKKIKEMSPEICLVFVTAYVEYAVQGYEANAFRYLLKPVTKEALEKLFGDIKVQSDKKKKLLVKTRQGELQIFLQDILYISAEDKYTVIYTREGHYISDASLTDYEKRLENKGFFRIHRKYLLNLYHQKGLEGGKVLLTDGQTLPVSKQRLKSYRDYLFRCMKENLL